ncbi:hypothetical protein FQN54_005182 [Arachnomyces sp. PD_36]|nr:hypothetical protein FQN54_005182 [Arachnomyces sp. PD_36]
MKFIAVVALLSHVVLTNAALGDAWINLIKEQCPALPDRCLDIAKQVHEPQFDFVEATKAAAVVPGCVPAYVACSKEIAGEDIPTSPGDARQLVTCLLNIAPDHIKYFLDNDKADTPIPSSQNCALRELHRVAHVELGPLA